MRIKAISAAEYRKWVLTANMLAKSVIPVETALSEFNALPSHTRKSIRNAMKEYDDVRRSILACDMSKEEITTAFTLSVFVDLHIIATEYETSPLVVALCVSPPCKDSERVAILKSALE